MCFLKRVLRNQKGISLNEMAVIIGIIIILAALLTPAIKDRYESLEVKSILTDIIIQYDASDAYFMDNRSATSVTTAKLISEKYLTSSVINTSLTFQADGRVQLGTIIWGFRRTFGSFTSDGVKYNLDLQRGDIEKALANNSWYLSNSTVSCRPGGSAGYCKILVVKEI